MWGGSYCPIIPAFGRVPDIWERARYRNLPKPEEIIAGYLDAYDPDIVVPVGVCEGHDFEVGHRDVVTPDDLLGDIVEEEGPAYGIGFIDVLDTFINEELRFERKFGLDLFIPEIKNPHKLFMASVLGKLPDSYAPIVRRYAEGLWSDRAIKPSFANLDKLLEPSNVFPRRLITEYLDRPGGDRLLFVCDATKPLDIIDYWNLRAGGYNVIPFPIQKKDSPGLRGLAVEVINQSFEPYRHNPNSFHPVTVQLSRSVSEAEASDVVDTWEVPTGDAGKSKFSIRHWYPRIWDEWARNEAQEGISYVASHEVERDIGADGSRLRLRSESPKKDFWFRDTGRPKYVNELSFSFFGSSEPMAEIIPEGSRELSTAIGRTSYHDWRFSRSGPVYFCSKKNGLIFVDLPKAEAVMTEWLRERGWEVTLSAPGRIAGQLLRQLGGVSNIAWLTHAGVIDLLRKLEKEGGKPHQAVMQTLRAVVKDDGLYIEPERFLQTLTKAEAIRLGAKIQCPVCTRHNWFELDALSYQLKCKFCLSAFSPPLDNPKLINWTYRSHGPFASSVAQGAFTVLLTLYFLSQPLAGESTPILSYCASKGADKIEADLTCLYRMSSWRNKSVQVVHAECKSFNKIEAADITRMRKLRDEFPGAVLIFSVLKESLSEEEQKRISGLVSTERRKRLQGKGFSPIIVLTGIELFSTYGFRNNWRERGGVYAKFEERYFDFSDLGELADATQQIYLELPSWHDWFQKEYRKKRKGRRRRNPRKLLERELNEH